MIIHLSITYPSHIKLSSIISIQSGSSFALFENLRCVERSRPRYIFVYMLCPISGERWRWEGNEDLEDLVETEMMMTAWVYVTGGIEWLFVDVGGGIRSFFL